jgi:hypothetical protein
MSMPARLCMGGIFQGVVIYKEQTAREQVQTNPTVSLWDVAAFTN